MHRFYCGLSVVVAKAKNEEMYVKHTPCIALAFEKEGIGNMGWGGWPSWNERRFRWPKKGLIKAPCHSQTCLFMESLDLGVTLIFLVLPLLPERGVTWLQRPQRPKTVENGPGPKLDIHSSTIAPHT
jgi:hypothetical protein